MCPVSATFLSFGSINNECIFSLLPLKCNLTTQDFTQGYFNISRGQPKHDQTESVIWVRCWPWLHNPLNGEFKRELTWPLSWSYANAMAPSEMWHFSPDAIVTHQRHVASRRPCSNTASINYTHIHTHTHTRARTHTHWQIHTQQEHQILNLIEWKYLKSKICWSPPIGISNVISFNTFCFGRITQRKCIYTLTHRVHSCGKEIQQPV